MPVFEVNGKKYEVDEDGFLRRAEEWDRDVARDLAATQGLAELSERHWKVIQYLRDHYLQFGAAPMTRQLCQGTGLKLTEIYEMFPSGPSKGACKVAGLPKPAGCA